MVIVWYKKGVQKKNTVVWESIKQEKNQYIDLDCCFFLWWFRNVMQNKIANINIIDLKLISFKLNVNNIHLLLWLI